MGNSVYEGSAHEQLLAKFCALEETYRETYQAQQKELTLVKKELALVQSTTTGIAEPLIMRTIDTINKWMFRTFVVPEMWRPTFVKIAEIPYRHLIRECRSSAFVARFMRFGNVYELEDFADTWSDVVSTPSLQLHCPLLALANSSGKVERYPYLQYPR